MTERVLEGLYAASIVDTVREPLMLLTEDLRILMVNRSCRELFGADQGQFDGRSLYEVDDHSWDIPRLRELLDHLVDSDTELRDFEVERAVPGGSQTLLLDARRLQHPDARVRLILLAFDDITDRRRLEQLAARIRDVLDRPGGEVA